MAVNYSCILTSLRCHNMGCKSNKALYLPLTVELRVREDGCHYGSTVPWWIAVHGADDLQTLHDIRHKAQHHACLHNSSLACQNRPNGSAGKQALCSLLQQPCSTVTGILQLIATSASRRMASKTSRDAFVKVGCRCA